MFRNIYYVPKLMGRRPIASRRFRRMRNIRLHCKRRLEPKLSIFGAYTFATPTAVGQSDGGVARACSQLRALSVIVSQRWLQDTRPCFIVAWIVSTCLCVLLVPSHAESTLPLLDDRRHQNIMQVHTSCATAVHHLVCRESEAAACSCYSSDSSMHALSQSRELWCMLSLSSP